MTEPLTTCAACKARYCDCTAPIWGYWWRLPGPDDKPRWSGSMARPGAVALRKTRIGDIEYGDVQRLTEPCPFTPPQCAGGATCTPECGCVTRALANAPGVIDAPFEEEEHPVTITVTQDELARLIFDGGKSRRREAWKHAEIEGEFDSHPLGDEEKIRFQHVLDRMWERGAVPEGKTIVDVEDPSREQVWREIAEERAAGVFQVAKSRK